MTDSNKDNGNRKNSLLRGYLTRQKEDMSREDGFGWSDAVRIRIVLVLTFFVLLILFTPDILLTSYRHKAGDFVSRNIAAPFSFSVENKEETERLRRSAELNAPAVYVYDSYTDDRIKDQCYSLLSTARTITLLPGLTRNEKLDRIYEQVGFPISKSAAESLLRYPEYRQFRETLNAIFASLDTTPVMGDEAYTQAANGENIQIWLESTRQLVSFNGFRESYGTIISQSMFRKEILEITQKKLNRPQDRAVRLLVLDIFDQMLQPNLVHDVQRSSEERQRYREQVKPVAETVDKGQIIVHANTVITPINQKTLDELSKNRWKYGFSIVLGRSVLLLLFGYFTALYMRRYYPKFSEDFNSMAPVCMLTVITVVITKLILSMGASPYLIPIASFAMLAGILFEMRFSLLLSIEMSVFLGVMLGLESKYVLVFMAAVTVASFAVTHILRRTDILRAGLLVSLFHLIGIVAIFFFDHPLYSVFTGKWEGLGFDLISGVLNGLLCYAITLAFVPLFEWMFNLTTDVKLLEFTDPRAPALQRLEEEAPGTYQHSLNLGQLAEAAANAIGSNALLCRISGYYQDIGKILKPEYFVENQANEDERKLHDKLTPNMSCLIIKNHVKYGIELAWEYKLPPPVIDIIAQHHGTTLMNYFYNKAIEEAKENGVDISEINEDDFRYPGPKPQTKEAAIVMLADSIEAAVTSLRYPTPGSIQSMVHKIINDKFNDEQLIECDITMRELELIRESLVRTLLSKYHRRIAYPDNPSTKGEKK